MTSENIQGVLLDCDYVIALSRVTETTHERALSLGKKILDLQQIILRPIAYELATVVSRKFDHTMAVKLMEGLQQSSVKWLDIDSIEPLIWKEFYSHSKKSTSFFDCANLVAARHYGLKIASFDAFYPKTLLA